MIDEWQPIDEYEGSGSVLIHYEGGDIEKAWYDGRFWRQCCDPNLLLTSRGLTHFRQLPNPPTNKD